MRDDSGIICKVEDGFRLHIKDDGTDYTAIWNDFRKGRLSLAKTFKNEPHREVYLYEHGSRKFILKIDRYVSRHLEVRLWNMLRGPFHSRQMKAIARAVQAGSHVTPEYFFTAERMEGGLCRLTYIIQEYFAGENLEQTKGFTNYQAAIKKSMLELHSHNLVLSDVAPVNFVVMGDEIKPIDLTWNGFVCIGKAQDIVRLKNHYGVELPVNGLVQRLTLVYIRAKHSLRDFLQRLGGKKTDSSHKRQRYRP